VGTEHETLESYNTNSRKPNAILQILGPPILEPRLSSSTGGIMKAEALLPY